MYKTIAILAVISLSLVLYACKKEPNETEETYVNPEYVLDYGNLPTPNIPADNKLTVEGVKLGRMLFYEKMLSLDNSVSCASCHNQNTGFSDINTLSKGVGGSLGKRQAMAVFNTLWHSNGFFWDGRANLLRHQALMPIQDELEMKETLPSVISKLQNSTLYQTQFKKAFNVSVINDDLVSKALEQFMNSIVSYNSKYDEFLAGRTTLTAEEERGRFLFFTEYNPAFPNQSGADCQHCHGGANFENDKYMNNGLDNDASITDIGFEKVTGKPQDKAKFKVTSLRNIELTPPYMHDGRFKTLEEVVEHYNLVKNSITLDPSFQQQLPNGLKLTSDDKKALVAFLKTLTDHNLAKDIRFKSPF